MRKITGGIRSTFLLIVAVLIVMILIVMCSFAPKQVIIPIDAPPTPISETVVPTPTPVPTSTTAPTPTTIPQAPIVVPPYIVPIVVLNEDGNLIGAANAFLVNKEKGQFATNAHVVEAGDGFMVVLNGKRYPLSVEGINWWADTAIVRFLDNLEILSSLEAVSFAERPGVGDVLYIRGYVFEPETGGLSIIPYSLDAEVLNDHSDWAVADQDYLGRALFSDLLLRQSIREGTPPEVPNILKHRYYEDYILLRRIKSPNGITSFKDGMSGTPVYTDKGRVVATISNIDGEDLGLAVPAGEIAVLLEEVNSLSEKSR